MWRQARPSRPMDRPTRSGQANREPIHYYVGDIGRRDDGAVAVDQAGQWGPFAIDSPTPRSAPTSPNEHQGWRADPGSHRRTRPAVGNLAQTVGYISFFRVIDHRCPRRVDCLPQGSGPRRGASYPPRHDRRTLMGPRASAHPRLGDVRAVSVPAGMPSVWCPSSWHSNLRSGTSDVLNADGGLDNYCSSSRLQVPCPRSRTSSSSLSSIADDAVRGHLLALLLDSATASIATDT